MIYNYLSDLLKEAQDNNSLDILIPLIQKFDKEYRGKELCGQNYKNYLEGIALEYHSSMLSRTREGDKN